LICHSYLFLARGDRTWDGEPPDEEREMRVLPGLDHSRTVMILKVNIINERIEEIEATENWTVEELIWVSFS